MKKHILINQDIHLTEMRATDKPNFVKYLNDVDVAANTLLVPSPYTEFKSLIFNYI
jgi:hypothetical protein